MEGQHERGAPVRGFAAKAPKTKFPVEITLSDEKRNRLLDPSIERKTRMNKRVGPSIVRRRYGDVVWCAIALGALLAAPYAVAKSHRTGASVPYTVYDGYFVSNKFEPNAADSFIVLRDQTAFDHLFGVAAVMFDRSRRLEPNAFRNDIVLAAIHRGHANVRYRVVGLTRDGTTLRVSYNTSAERTPSTEYACPLILSTRRDNYSAVAFVENGKLVKTVRVNGASR
jgi:hypothetical protein